MPKLEGRISETRSQAGGLALPVSFHDIRTMAANDETGRKRLNRQELCDPLQTRRQARCMPLFEWPKPGRDDRPRQYVQAGRALENEGRFPEALNAFEAALRIDPNYPDALYGQGGSLHGMARLVNAKAGGSIYFKAGLDLLDDAIRCFENLVRIDPAADAYLNLALAYDNRSRLDDAEDAYLNAIRVVPEGQDGCDARFNLALLYFMRAKGAAGKPDPKTVAKQPVNESLMSQAIEMSKEAARMADRLAAADPRFAPNAAT